MHAPKYKHRPVATKHNVQPTETLPPNESSSLAEKHAAVLTFQRNQLEITLAELESDLNTLARVDADLDEKLREEDMAVESESIHVNEAMLDTMTAVSDVLKTLEWTTNKDSISVSHLFQCPTALSFIFDAYLVYETELAGLTTVMFALGGHADRTYQETKDELERLINIYSVTEIRYADAMAEVEAAKAELRVLEETLDTGVKEIIINPDILKSQIATYQTDSMQHAHRTTNLRAREIGPIINNLADLSIRVPGLTMDYQAQDQDLKQREGKIDKIVFHLLTQYAYQQSLHHALALELKRYHHTRHLICATGESWRKKEAEVGMRVEHISAPYFVDRKERKTVDVRDDYLMAVKQLLDVPLATDSSLTVAPTAAREFFITMGSLADRIEGLLIRRDEAMKKIDQGEKMGWKLTEDCREAQTIICKTLYKDSPSQDDLVMMPKELTDLQQRLEQRTNELNQKMRDITRDATMTRELAQRQRLFSLFWRDPEMFLSEFGK